jgi:hypothetical protein
LSPAPLGSIGLRHHQGDSVPFGNEGGKIGRGEFGRAHENNAQRWNGAHGQ